MRLVRGALALGMVLTNACAPTVPHAASGIAQDAGPRADVGVAALGGARVSSASTGDPHQAPGPDAGAPAGGCVTDGTYRILAFGTGGMFATDVAGTWTFSNEGTTVDTPAGTWAVSCDGGSRVTIHGPIGLVPDATSMWAAWVDAPGCLIFTNTAPLDGGSIAIGRAQIDFAGPR